MSDMLVLSLVLIALLCGLIRNKVSPAILFILASFFCYLVGIGSFESLVNGFSNNGLLVLTLLLLCSIALEKTPMLSIMGKIIGNGSLPLCIARLGFSAALLSSFTNNTAVVASMISAVRRNTSHAPSKLLLPLSYCAILGGTLTLIGTSTNLIVNAFVVDANLPPIGFFEFTQIGLMLVVSGVMLLMLLCRWLPNRNRIENQVSQMYFFEAKVAKDSPLINKTVQENGLKGLKQVYLVEVERNDVHVHPASPRMKLQAGDLLRFSGVIEAVELLQQFKGLEWFDEQQVKGQSIVEAVLSASSSLIGSNLKESAFREQFDAVVMGVRRGHFRLRGSLGDIKLMAGDVLLLAPGENFGDKGQLRTDFAAISGLDLSVRIDGKKSTGILVGFTSVIALNLMGIFPIEKGLLIYLLLNILLGTISLREIRRRFPVVLVVIVGCALFIAKLMLETGLANLLSNGILWVFDGYGVYGAFIAVYFLTLILTELITNNASAALAFPIAYAISINYGVDPRPFIMAVIFGASASFISPYGYQTNLMVFSAGDYEVKDYLKIGVPLSIMYSLISLAAIPIFFPF